MKSIVTALVDPSGAADYGPDAHVEIWSELPVGITGGVATDRRLRVDITETGLSTPPIRAGNYQIRIKLSANREALGPYPFTMPDGDGTTELWPLIAAAVNIPPDTPVQKIQEALAAYLIANPIDGDGLDQTEVDARIETVGDTRYARLYEGAQLDVDESTPTSVINAWLAAPSPLGIKRLIGSAAIDAPLVLWSDTHLDATGATITLEPGSNCRMLQTAAFGTAGWTTNIAAVGGLWDRGSNEGAGNDLHSLVFTRADGLYVRDVAVRSTGGKYSILLADSKNFTVDTVDFDVSSDGVHMQGPLSDGVVRNIRGTTGDDTVAITARDYSSYDIVPGGGNVSNITIEDVFCVNGLKQAVKVLAGLGTTVSAVKIQRIFGTVATQGVSIFHDTVLDPVKGGVIDGVTIRDVDLITDPNYGAVQVSAPGVKNLTVDGVAVRAGRGMTVASNAEVDGLTLRNFSTHAEYNKNLVDVVAGAVVTGQLTMDNVVAAALTDKSAGRLFSIAGSVASLALVNCGITAGDAIGYISGTVPRISLANVRSTSQYGVRHTAANAVAVDSRNVSHTSGFGILRLTGAAGCTGVLTGSNTPGTAFSRSGTQPMRVSGSEWKVDTSTLSPVAGDLVYNTSAAQPQGVGLSVYSGSAWKSVTPASLAGPNYLDRVFSGLDMRENRSLVIAQASDSTGDSATEWFELAWKESLAEIWPERPARVARWIKASEVLSAFTSWQAGEPTGAGAGGDVTVGQDLFETNPGPITGRTPDVGAGNWSTSGSGTWSVASGALSQTDSATFGNAAFQMQSHTLDGEYTAVLDLATAGVTSVVTFFPVTNSAALSGNRMYVQLSGNATIVPTLAINIGGATTTLATLPSFAITGTPIEVTITVTVADLNVTVQVGAESQTVALTQPQKDALIGQYMNVGVNKNPNAKFKSLTATVPAPAQYLPQVSVYNGGYAGGRASFQTDRLASMFPVRPDVVFINHGHNYASIDSSPAAFVAAIDTFVASLRAVYADVPVVVLSQNPEIVSGSTTQAAVDGHLARQVALRDHALSLGWGYIAGLEAFAKRSDGGAALIDTADGTGIHPNATGSRLQADTAKAWIAGESRRD